MDDLAALLRRADPDRYVCTLFAPAAHRPALLALYAFNHELARACEVTREPGLSLIRLQWWREVVQGAPRAHPVAVPLQAALCAGALAEAPLLEMIAAREREAEGDFETVAAWHDWLHQGAGTLMAAAGALLGAPDAADLRARGAGCAAIGQLRNLRALAAQGRCLLPAELLARAGLSPDQLIAAPDALPQAARSEITALAHAALGPPRPCPRRWIAAVLPCALARRPPGVPGLPGRLAIAAAYARARC